MDYSTEPPTQYTYKSCSAAETHAMKLLMESFCVNVDVKRGLELYSY